MFGTRLLLGGTDAASSDGAEAARRIGALVRDAVQKGAGLVAGGRIDGTLTG